MQIEHGPPGSVGVKQLAYMGDVDSGLHGIAHPLAALAIGTYGYAWVTKNRKLRRQAGAVAVGAFLVSLFTR